MFLPWIKIKYALLDTRYVETGYQFVSYSLFLTKSINDDFHYCTKVHVTKIVERPPIDFPFMLAIEANVPLLLLTSHVIPCIVKGVLLHQICVRM